MPARRNNRRYLLWLALGTTFMAAAMAVLLALQVTQQRSIRKSSDLRSDSITALAFQLEREFLRLRQALELHAQSEVPKPLNELRLRSDIFASRFQVMHDTPSTTALHEQRAYMETMPRLEALVTRTDQLLGSDKAPSQKEFQQLVEEFNGLGPDVQELTMAANRHVSSLLEEQESTMLTQSGHIMVLIVAQLVILLLAAAALAWRQYRQEKERQALQRLTESLQAANAAAEEANRGKSQFLANMSHELRTPFNGVLGMLTLLERTRLDSSQREYVYTARHSADHLLSLLNDILDVSAMEAGKMSIHPVPVHLPPLLEGIEKLMRPLAQQKGLGFAMELTNDLPSWVEADGTRLRQIFLNLVTNAIKFSDAGTVAVKVGRDEKAGPDQPNIYPLRLDVVDEGIGMDHATLTKLFERFAQGDASTSRRFGGTGLGLEISRNLARRMGGDIKAHSVLGQGSTFTVTLPLALAAPPKLPVSLGQPPHSGGVLG
uniref:sensor histidine kinase n=1 Tax=uncultured Acidovorax sp. TaxID=158751 RepID=UPI0030F74618